jgi:hypothetical protein
MMRADISSSRRTVGTSFGRRNLLLRSLREHALRGMCRLEKDGDVSAA